MANRTSGRLERLELGRMGPDWENPRFLPASTSRFASDEDVYAYIDSKYDAFSIADSIARHGYFESEPLIAMGAASAAEYTVLEGNRRLTALKALADPSVRARMSQRRWTHLPDEVELPDDYPVLIVDSRTQVAPILGFRHITGIAPWDPYQQSLYVASLIDGPDEMGADDVAELIGRDASEVRAFYRNFSIVEQAEREFEIADPKRVVDEFGVWTRAMTSTGIRAYIGAPAPREVVERDFPLDPDVEENLERLIIWLFGLPRSEAERSEGRQSKKGRLITDSRQLSRLGRVMQHPRGLAALEAGEDLDHAERAMLDIRAQFAAAVADARDALGAAEKYRPKRLSEAVEGALVELREIIERLLAGP